MPSLPRTPSRLRRAPAFLPIGTLVAPCALTLGGRRLARFRTLGALLLIHRKNRSPVVTDPIQLRSNFTRMRAGPPKHTDELTTPDIPINMLTENQILWVTGSAVQPSAGLPSSHSFHGEVSSSGRLLLSIPLVQLCAAHNTKIAPCSLPRPKAPLRSGD
jgi:hypothetical protein